MCNIYTFQLHFFNKIISRQLSASLWKTHVIHSKMTDSSPDLPKFTELNDLACERDGGKILFATDDFFAACENIIKSEAPVFKEGLFTEFGKWMDGWETRRKRITGHDWCILQLGFPAQIYGIDVDTRHFIGNYPPKLSIQAAHLTDVYPARDPERLGSAPNEREMKWAETLQSDTWDTLVPMTELKPGYPSTSHNYFFVSANKNWTHLRINLFPDGGIARFHVYGVVRLDWTKIPETELMDMSTMQSGGVVLKHSNAHFGHARNLIEPKRARNMGEGWETARRLDRPAVLTLNQNGTLNVPGSEWVIIRLGHAALITEIEVDTHHFKGNAPDSCFVEGCYVPNATNTESVDGPWKLLMPTQKLRPHERHWFKQYQVIDIGPVTHVRLIMAPDGGISRFRVWGYKRS